MRETVNQAKRLPDGNGFASVRHLLSPILYQGINTRGSPPPRQEKTMAIFPKDVII